MQALYEYARQGSPAINAPAVAPAVGALDTAARELLASRKPNHEPMVKRLAKERQQLLEKALGRATVYETAFVLIDDLERHRKHNIYGIDDAASHTSYAIYTIHQNYMSVLEQLSDKINKDSVFKAQRRLRKLPL